MYIYCITNNINGKKYVGKCHRTPERSLGYYGSGKLIKQAIAKNGKENFTKEILERDLTIDTIEDREIFWIKELNTKAPIGYNLCDGGGGLMNPTEEVRKKMSESRKGEKSHTYGKHLSEETKRKIGEKSKLRGGENHPNYGKHRSEETKKKISEANKKYVGELNSMYGKKHTEETKAKMSKIQKGRKHTPETIEKVRQKMIGRKHSEEHRKKISEGNKGKKMSPESIEKTRQKNIGRKHTEETKVKISNVQKGKKLSEEHKKNVSDKLKEWHLNNKSKSRKKVMQIDIITNKTIKEFDSIIEAAKECTCSATKISDCCKGKRKTTGGFKWKYIN
jgi:group I intron endonuclease